LFEVRAPAAGLAVARPAPACSARACRPLFWFF